MKNIFANILGLCAVFAVVSCDVDAVGTIYEPDSSNNGVTFSQTLFTNSEISASATTFTVVVNRAVAGSAQTVGISSTLPADIVVPGSVSFAAGEYTADLVLDISKMSVGTTYRGSVALADENAYDAKTGISSANVVLAKAYEWTSVGTGQFFEYFWEGFVGDVEILKADGFNLYRVLNPYAATADPDATGPKPGYIQFEVVDNAGTVHFNTWQSPYDYDGEGHYIKFYRPSEASASYAAYDNESVLEDNYYVALLPYIYIDGVGGWNVGNGYCIGIALPGAPKSIDEWFDEKGLL